MRRIEQRFYQKICIHGMSLDKIAEEIDSMDHRTKAQYYADGSMFTSSYRAAKDIIAALEKRKLIIKKDGKYKKA